MDKRGVHDWFVYALYILAGGVVILALIGVFVLTADKSYAKELKMCEISLTVGETGEDLKGPFKFFTKKADLCSTYPTTVGEYGGGPQVVEEEIMRLIAKAWTTTLQGQPKVFGSRFFSDKSCYIVWVFDIEEKRNEFEKGMFIPADDFWADLGAFPYNTFEGEEYTYLDYVQDSPSGYPGRIDVFPSLSSNNPKLCYDDVSGRKLSDAECKAKKDAAGFYPNGVYAIAVVSGQGSLDFIPKPDIANNYVIVDRSDAVEKLCDPK